MWFLHQYILQKNSTFEVTGFVALKRATSQNTVVALLLNLTRFDTNFYFNEGICNLHFLTQIAGKTWPD